MIDVFEDAKRMEGAVLVHVITRKGKGYRPAEDHPAKYHGVPPFSVKTGEIKECTDTMTYTEVFSEALVRMADLDGRVTGITAAMPFGSGLYDFSRRFPERFFDVGIAEEHAVTFAAGMAASGMRPVVAIYSSFLQRAYDQILHDVAMQNLPVIFAIDRAGLVGQDGETHQGIYDVGFLSTIPGLVIMSPRNGQELVHMLRIAMTMDGPVAIRYPKGAVPDTLAVRNLLTAPDTFRKPLSAPAHFPFLPGQNEILARGSGILMMATGAMVETARKTAEILEKEGMRPTLVNIRFLEKADLGLLRYMQQDHRVLVMIEEVVEAGSYGERLAAAALEEKLPYTVVRCALPDGFVEQGTVSEQRKRYGLTPEMIADRIREVYGKD